jgi:hypothetical protein
MPREKGEESEKRIIIIALEKSRWIPFPLFIMMHSLRD